MPPDPMSQAHAEHVAEQNAEWDAEAVCPNADDPVLCKVHDGVFIPEAGCPTCDPDEAPNDGTVICECGHTKRIHIIFGNGCAADLGRGLKCRCLGFKPAKEAS